MTVHQFFCIFLTILVLFLENVYLGINKNGDEFSFKIILRGKIKHLRQEVKLPKYMISRVFNGIIVIIVEVLDFNKYL